MNAYPEELDPLLKISLLRREKEVVFRKYFPSTI